MFEDVIFLVKTFEKLCCNIYKLILNYKEYNLILYWVGTKVCSFSRGGIWSCDIVSPVTEIYDIQCIILSFYKIGFILKIEMKENNIHTGEGKMLDKQQKKLCTIYESTVFNWFVRLKKGHFNSED